MGWIDFFRRVWGWLSSDGAAPSLTPTVVFYTPGHSRAFATPGHSLTYATPGHPRTFTA